MAYTERGIYYQTDYNEDADILEDMKKMAESIDEVVENSEASADEQYVKKVAGKGLSTNDYDDTEKGKVQANTTARHTHSNKSILDETTASYTIEKDEKLDDLENYDDTELRGEINQNTTNIETLQAENTKLQTQVNTLKEITSQMPQVSDSGEEVYLADTIKAPFTEFEVKGHSEQGKILPDGYTQLDYIESVGNQYIDTGITADDTVEFDVGFETFDQFTAGTGFGCVFGSRQASVNKELQITTFTDAGITNGTFRYGSDASYEASLLRETKMNIKLKDKKYYVNGVQKLTLNQTFSNDYNIYIFALNNGGTSAQYGKVRIYTFKLYKNGNLVRDYIPSKNASNELGLYDLVTDIFYKNAATGTFVAGDEVTIPNPNYPVDVKSCGENVNEFDKDNADITNAILTDGGKYQVNGGNRCVIFPCDSSTIYAISKKLTTRFRVSESEVYPVIGSDWTNRISKDTFSEIIYTTGSNTKYLIINFWENNSIITEQEALDSIKIEKGTVATPWSPYGMGCVNEKVSNKNWFKMDTPGTYTINGVTFKTNGDGSVTVTGTSTNYIYAYVKDSDGYVNTVNSPDARKIKVPANVPVTLSGKSTNVRLVIRNITDSTTIQGTTATFSKETNIAIQFYIPTGTTVNETLYPMLEFTSTTTSYVPHEEQNKSIPVQQPMRSIGDVRDDFVKIDGVRYERHKIGRNGLSGITVTDFNTTYNRFTLLKSTVNVNAGDIEALSNVATVIAHGSVNANYTNAMILRPRANGGVYIYCWLDGITSLEEAQSYIANNNDYVDIPLADPILLPCTAEQTAILDELDEEAIAYQGGTYISSEDEVKARIKVSGLKDLNVMFEDLTNAIISQGANT